MVDDVQKDPAPPSHHYVQFGKVIVEIPHDVVKEGGEAIEHWYAQEVGLHGELSEHDAKKYGHLYPALVPEKLKDEVETATKKKRKSGAEPAAAESPSAPAAPGEQG